MRESDGRKLDHATLEALRLRTVKQVLDGANAEELSTALGLHPKTVFGWMADYRRGGFGALKRRPVPGRAPKLDPGQLRRLQGFIAGDDPRRFGFEFALWTRDIVKELIRREFDVSLSVTSVGQILKKLGFSAQRPLYRAWQADPDAVAAWKDQDYPAIAARARAAGATVYFVDEASVRSDYHAGTTWAPVGITPVVATTGARFSVNMISAISAQGRLRFSIVDGTLDSKKLIEFFKRLLHHAPGPVFAILDNHSVHRSTAVRTFVESTNGALEVYRLPSYSPQLNPDEWVWKNVKHDRVGRRSVSGPDQFKALAVSALRRLQAAPFTVRGFFADPDLAYIATAA